jgi:hypothetical protein
MNSKIYVSSKEGGLIELSQQMYKSEDDLQKLIAKHHELLAGEQIDPVEPRLWVLVKREMGVPSETDGGFRWSLDHLFVDQDAIPTLVEVKLSTNPEARRKVVGQMLDYAANASVYWTADMLQAEFVNSNEDFIEAFASLGLDYEKADDFWARVGENMRSGKIRLLFVSDQIPKELLAIIEFLNERMPETEVLGLEIKQYLSKENLTTLVPAIVGNTPKAIDAKGHRGVWTEAEFLERANKINGLETAETIKRLLKSFTELGFSQFWGKGKFYGTVYFEYQGNIKHTPFSINHGDKKVYITVEFRRMGLKFDTPQYRAEIKSRLEKIAGVKININKAYPGFPIDLLNDGKSYDMFISVIKSCLEDIEKSDESLPTNNQ